MNRVHYDRGATLKENKINKVKKKKKKKKKIEHNIKKVQREQNIT